MLLQVINDYSASISLILIVIFEFIATMYIYGEKIIVFNISGRKINHMNLFRIEEFSWRFGTNVGISNELNWMDMRTNWLVLQDHMVCSVAPFSSGNVLCFLSSVSSNCCSCNCCNSRKCVDRSVMSERISKFSCTYRLIAALPSFVTIAVLRNGPFCVLISFWMIITWLSGAFLFKLNQSDELQYDLWSK